MSPSPSAAQRRQNLKDFLVCFSVGNLCFIRRWYDLENLQAHSVDYYRNGPPNPTLLISTAIAGLLLSLTLWLGWRWLQRNATPARVKVAQFIFLVLLIFPLESVRRYWNHDRENLDIGSNAALLFVEGILAVGAILSLTGKPRVVYSARRVMVPLVFLYPALMIDFGWSYTGAEPAASYQAKPSLSLLPPRPGPQRRVLWIVFDELDPRALFENRPADLELPEIDRLRRESVLATNAAQTAPYTVIALPSLISGKLFQSAQMLEADKLQLLAENSAQKLNWADQPNVFRRARHLGVNAALVGWHHPYCRVLGDSLVNCFALPSGHPTAALLRETHAAEEGVWSTVAYLFRLQVQNVIDMIRWDGKVGSESLKSAYVQARQQQQYFRIRDRVYAAAIDRQVEFVFAHLPTPHPFAIYDRKRRDFKLSGDTDYLDNVALVDRTIGELRQELEREGLWDSTTLLVTADHGLRPKMWAGHYNWTEEMKPFEAAGTTDKVPFLLKLAGQREATEFDRPFSAVVTGDLCLAVLGGEVTTAQEASAWLAAHESAPSGGGGRGQALTKR